MPLRLLLAVAVAAAGSVVAAGCGAVDAAPAAAGAQDPETDGVRTTVYFLTDGGSAPIGVRRTIAGRSPYAREALAALLAGPTAEERRAGITSAIPPGTTLRSLRFEDHGAEAFVDLSGLPADAGTLMRVRVITQVTRTLVGVSGIQEVWLRADGSPFGLWLMRGGIENVPYGYDDLLGFYGICTAKPGTEAVPGECFSALP